tara:strand:+ start:337 stop:864 length:528 start_codon:yes stop_codon:yes gene_type:complete
MKKFVIILLSSIILLSPVYGAGSGGSGSSGGSGDGDNIQDGPKPAGKFRLGYKEVERANKAAKKGKLKKAEQKYKKALNHLLEANAEDPGNPDILNYLGFTSRKLGDFKNSEIYYLLGLEIDPNHVGINEYLGELYVTTNRHNLAVERLEVLKDCSCKEYNDLKAIIAGEKVSKY